MRNPARATGHANLRRRPFLKVAAAALMAPRLARAAGEPLEKELVFSCNGGILEAMFHNLGNTFEQKTGTKVSLVIGTALGNLAKIQVAKNAPEIDVAFSPDLPHVAGKQSGVFEKLDTAAVPNLADVYDIARDPAGVGVGCLLTAIGIGYNPKQYQQAGIPAPTAWADLWDSRLKGKLAICTFDVTWIQDFLVLMARLAGGSEANIKPGIAKIKELKTNGNLVLTPGSPAELENILTQNLAWATVTSANRAFLLRKSGFPFEFVYPKEGAGLTANWIDVVKGAPHPRAARAFANHIMSEQGQMILASNFYGPTNKNVVLPPELAAVVPYGAERIKTLVAINRDRMNADLDQWNELYNREILAK
jgi:putative spermidine/putrescine transport system substrate-binding protein